MKRWLRRILAIALGTVLASGTILAYHCWKDPGGASLVQERLQDAWVQYRAERVSERARKEADRLDSHAWAGTYRSAGMWGTDLVLTHSSGFAVYHNSMCGTCARWLGYGRIRELGPRELRLDPGIAVEAELSGLDGDLLLVPWSDFLFAVPAAQIEAFCRRAARGGEFPNFRFRGASRGESVPTTLPGLPEVPERFAHLLADPPDEDD